MHRNYLAAFAVVAAAAAVLPAASQAKQPAAHGCVVPKLAGDTLAIARKQLTRADCRTGSIYETKLKQGQTATFLVSGESPRPVTHEPGGRRVSLTLKATDVKTKTSPTPIPPTTVTTAAATPATTATTAPPAPVVTTPTPTPTVPAPVVTTPTAPAAPTTTNDTGSNCLPPPDDGWGFDLCDQTTTIEGWSPGYTDWYAIDAAEGLPGY